VRRQQTQINDLAYFDLLNGRHVDAVGKIQGPVFESDGIKPAIPKKARGSGEAGRLGCCNGPCLVLPQRLAASPLVLPRCRLVSYLFLAC
jgi:hypothetical protein